MKVRELMTKQPVTVEPDATLGEVATLMKQEDCGSIPVVEAGRLVGIVTAYDFLSASARLFEKYLTTSACEDESSDLLKSVSFKEDFTTKGVSR